MPGRQVVGLLIPVLCLTSVACGGDDARPGRPGAGGAAAGGGTGGSGAVPAGGGSAAAGDGGGSSGGAGGGGMSGGGASGGGMGGDAGGSGGAGAGAAGGASGGTGAGGGGAGGSGGGPAADPVCPNGIAEADEGCDGADFWGLSCADFGFADGDLVCAAGCLIDADGCSGTETCTDGRDNDGDGDVDCLDADCTAVCADDCGNVTTVTLPAVVEGTTLGHDPSADASCTSETGAADISYRVVAPKAGVLVATLEGTPTLAVSLRSACTGGTEYSCAFGETTRAVAQGETVFVHVDGNRATTIGSFSLSLVVTSTLCGNNERDAGEECDDGALFNGQSGCSKQCTVDSSEVGDNDTVGTADLYDGVYGGHITQGDVDYVAFVVPNDNTGAIIEINDFGDGGCAAGAQDTYLELIAPDGSTVLASNDDYGANLCSRLIINGASNLDAGTYYVRVSAPPLAPNETFPYRLLINTDRCGNGVQALMEQCDGGAGCGSDCRTL